MNNRPLIVFPGLLILSSNVGVGVCDYNLSINGRSRPDWDSTFHSRYLNEVQAKRHYFHSSFEYNVILQFLSRYHGITMSSKTVCYRLKQFGLSRRHAPEEIDEERVAHLIRQKLNGDGCLLGYRAMWQLIRRKYHVKVPRRVVQRLLREIDPEGSNERIFHRLK
jgi:hypothetical protein